jgi:hypothetical protein
MATAGVVRFEVGIRRDQQHAPRLTNAGLGPARQRSRRYARRR